jgi:glycosyltransferase involved in cell wall biosynthesis
MQILFINQAFYPDVVATSQVLTDLAVTLAAEGHEVTVVAAATGYDGGRERFPSRETWKGIEIHRVSGTRFGKTARWRRAIDFATFWIACAARVMRLRRHDVVVTLTSPPLISLLGAIRTMITGGRLVVWTMDLNPDEAIAAGWLRRDSYTARTLQSLLTFSLQRAATVVVLDRFMKARIVARGIAAENVIIAPPWSHDDDVRFDADGRQRFRTAHGLGDAFVVMYAGNHSPCHPLETLLDAARALRDRRDVRFVFMGGGSEVERVRRFVRTHDLANVTQLPYQPLASLSEALSAADLHAVLLGDPFVGIVHPCKIYNILRVGSRVLYIGPPESHVTDLAKRASDHPVYAARHGDAAAVVTAILAASEASFAAGVEVEAGCSKSDILPRMLEALGATARAEPASSITEMASAE